MKSLNIKIKYSSFKDNILEDFYLPVLNKTQKYYRAVGYFSSKILVEYTKGIIELINKNGEIKLIISPYLTDKDLDELNNQTDCTENKINELFEKFLQGNSREIAASKLLILLINKGYLEIKIAEPKNAIGLFHEKIGIFIDENENMIAIIGSNNETEAAITLNQESFNTFCSWKNGQEDYVTQHLNDFEEYWNGQNVNIVLTDLKDALDQSILKKLETYETYDELLDNILEEEKEPYNLDFTPYPFQKDAVDKWLTLEKGIFKFATGSGKTKTAIYLMERLKLENKKLMFVIVVPDKTLVNQWYEQLEKYDNKIIKCYLSSATWKKDLRNVLSVFDIFEKRHQVIISTMNTFFDYNFQSEFKKNKEEYILIVDECHSWGTEKILNNLPETQKKLGLSATPELFFSKDKTTRLLAYFGGIIAEYSLRDAIKDGKLVPYKYYPIEVNLTSKEKMDYDELTLKIVRILGHDVTDITDSYSKALEMLLFKRAKIVYGAINKIERLDSLIDELENEKNLIIYCGATSYLEEHDSAIKNEAMTQLELVNSMLSKKGLKFAKYTSEENEYERDKVIKHFKDESYSTLVAIKCLDEGVDIPQIQKAIILASSTNPREFIQRRGRILRSYPGKEYSIIYDFIVIDSEYDSLMKKELERINEFAKLAINSIELYDKYQDLFNRYLVEGEVYDE